jgi:outer membrane protein W
MKKAVALMIVLIFIPLSAYAASDRIGKWSAGINTSAGIFPVTGVDSAFNLGGNFGYELSEYFSLGMSAGWMNSDFRLNAPDGSGKFKAGQVTMVPIFGDIIIWIPTGGRRDLAPYAVVGLGGLFTHVHNTGAASDANLGVKSQNAFAAKFGGGADWYLNDSWVVNFEGGYVVTNAEMEVTNAATGDYYKTNNLNYFYVGGGVKYLFS